MKELKYFEVEFKDGYSICIRGKRRPTLSEAATFCKADCETFGEVVKVLPLDISEALSFFDMDDEESLPIFS